MSKFDYEKLFAVGNFVMLDDGCSFVIDGEHSQTQILIDMYGNDSLKSNHEVYVPYTDEKRVYTIQYITNPDPHDPNEVTVLFDRRRDMPKPMPELEVGDILYVVCVLAYGDERDTSSYAVIREYDGNMILSYIDNACGWDLLNTFDEFGNNRVYPDTYEKRYIKAVWKDSLIINHSDFNDADWINRSGE